MLDGYHYLLAFCVSACICVCMCVFGKRMCMGVCVHRHTCACPCACACINKNRNAKVVKLHFSALIVATSSVTTLQSSDGKLLVNCNAILTFLVWTTTKCMHAVQQINLQQGLWSLLRPKLIHHTKQKWIAPFLWHINCKTHKLVRDYPMYISQPL